MPQPDYRSLLDEAVNGGFEAFETKQPATADEYREYVHLLGQVVEMRALLEERITNSQILTSETAKIQQSILNFQPPEITPETGLDLYDSERLNLLQARNWLAALDKIGATRQIQAEEAFGVLKQQQQKLQALESAGPPASPRDAWLLKLQRARVAAALADQQARADSSSWTADTEQQKARVELADLNIKSLAGRVSFPASLLQARREATLNTEESFAGTIRGLEKQIKNFAFGNPFKGEPILSKIIFSGLESQLQFLEYRRVGVMIQNQLWQSRYDLWNSADAESLEKISRGITERMQDVQIWQPLISGVRTKLQDRRRRASAALVANGSRPSPNLRDIVDKAFEQEESALSKWENDFSSLMELVTLANADIAIRRKSLGLGINLDAAALTLAAQTGNIWNTELFTLTDSVFVNGQVVQRPSSVTLGMMLTALLILVAGGFISSATSQWLRSRLTQRFSLDANTGAIVQKATNFFLLFLISLVALAVVRIPLTIFALLGGAAAIAVGFGAQQLVNNLISGIILLFERPIRIGDLIDVGTFSGTVTAIGTRCSQLSRADGVEILIPNSVILQSTVVNWTLSDRHARQEMLIGIAYGSPVEQATRTIRDIARAHSGVLKNKDLDVYFHDFGPDSIVLRLLYWIDKGIPDSTNQVPSEIRLAIYNSFNQEGITLAFPQRDVHLDAVKPIAVHLVANPSK